jgi:hypothetical protein
MVDTGPPPFEKGVALLLPPPPELMGVLARPAPPALLLEPEAEEPLEPPVELEPDDFPPPPTPPLPPPPPPFLRWSLLFERFVMKGTLIAWAGMNQETRVPGHEMKALFIHFKFWCYLR